MTKKEPATETNPQQALGFIKYVVCPFVIINVACIFTRFHKDKYCFPYYKKITGINAGYRDSIL